MLLATILLAAVCPLTPPDSLAIYSTAGCGVYTACPNGAVEWQVGPMAIGPNPTFGGYRVEPCDTVEWNFGDGTTATATGVDRITHDYPLPGNYTVHATVTNSLGSASATVDAVVATSPSTLAYAPLTTTVHEGDGAASIDIVRGGDTSRSVSADAVVLGPDFRTVVQRVPLQFAPGETKKTIAVPIADDSLYEGTRRFHLTIENGRGGVVVAPASAQIVVVDNDPPPTLTIDPAVTVAEGDSGLTQILIPVHLSAPMGVTLFAAVSFTPLTVLPNDVGLVDGSVVIAPGQTTGAVKVTVRANTLPEPDKTFLVTLIAGNGDADPILGDPKTSFVTALNDDAAIYPAQTTMPAGIAEPLTLNIGSPFPVPTTVTFTSSAPDVVPVPDPVTMPAGETKVWVTVAPRAAGVAEIGAVVPGRTTQPATVFVTGERRHAAAR